MRLFRENRSRKMCHRYTLAHYSRLRTNSSNPRFLLYGKKLFIPMHMRGMYLCQLMSADSFNLGNLYVPL